MKSNLISKSETAKIFEELNTQWKIDKPKQKNVRTHQIDEKGVIITGNGVTAVKIGEDILPFLGDVPILEKFSIMNGILKASFKTSDLYIN